MAQQPKAANDKPATIAVVMGVSGAGKSTVATELASQLGWDLADGDDFHPPGNVAKMASGAPLTDADRRPWLDQIAGWIDEEIANQRHGVIACSALKRAYRDRLRRPQVLFVYLDVPRVELERRLAQRVGHFMPGSLLDSQLRDLEPPDDDEAALKVRAGEDASRVAQQIARALTGPKGA
jgi:carbohydrate kinase (thermoresistant glucokinase family)